MLWCVSLLQPLSVVLHDVHAMQPVAVMCGTELLSDVNACEERIDGIEGPVR
jgi:hypothetical protein